MQCVCVCFFFFFFFFVPRACIPNFHVMQFYMWHVILGVPPVDVGCCWEEVSEVFALGGVVSGGGAK